MKNIIRHIRQSLSLKLSFGILLMSVPIFLVSLGIVFVQSRRQIKREATEHASSLLNTTIQRVVRQLNTIETATSSNSWKVLENMQPDSLLDYSRRIVLLNANVSGCSITPEPYTFPQLGKYFSAYSVREGDSITTVREKPYDYYEKVWYKTPKKLGRACWVDPFDDFNEGTLYAKELIASYCMPLYRKDGQMVGVVSTDLSLNQLSEIISAEKPFSQSYFMMLGEKGTFFVHPDSALLVDHTIFSATDAKRHPDVIALGHEMVTGQRGNMQVRLDGADCLVCYAPVPNTPWSIALVCLEDDILHSYNQLTYLIALLIGVGLLLILVFCHRIVGHSVRPLSRLVSQLQRLASGHYGERIAHSYNRDVIGRLQNSFATMQESLSRHISDIEQMNAESARRNDELLRASEMVEESNRQKTLFIQNMTHQIRTPLNIMMGFAQVLRDSAADLPSHEVQNITQTMQHNAMSLSRMVLMLYDSSDLGLSEELRSLSREQVSCNAVARRSIEHTLRHFPNLNIRFETSVPDELTIPTSRTFLLRSLREFLYNSAKYSDGLHISLTVSKTDTHVLFIFQDTGSGISEEYYNQMYVPFTKVDDLSEGLGLGLPLAKRHVENLGGELLMDTDYHAGCRFIVKLPLK